MGIIAGICYTVVVINKHVPLTHTMYRLRMYICNINTGFEYVALVEEMKLTFSVSRELFIVDVNTTGIQLFRYFGMA